MTRSIAAKPDGLDVDRLAVAILASRWYGPDDIADARIAAAGIAAEYAKLRSHELDDAEAARIVARPSGLGGVFSAISAAAFLVVGVYALSDNEPPNHVAGARRQ